MQEKGLKRAVNIFKYSDSEPNEVFTSILHTVILPMALWSEMFSSPLLVIGSIICGLFQGWAVLWDGRLSMRSHATKVAFLVAVATVLNYTIEGMLHGSNVGWLLVLIFATWNIIRVEKQKTYDELKSGIKMDSWIQIAVTIVTVLGSGAAFTFYTNRMKMKAQARKDESANSDTMLYRDDLKNRVRNLEELLAHSANEKDDLRSQILDLTAEVHSLRVKVDFLEKENERLKMK